MLPDNLILVWLLVVSVLVFLVVPAAYLISRAASIAHFRTKLEYFRSVIREGGGTNGDK